jgi:hypothetical protein
MSEDAHDSGQKAVCPRCRCEYAVGFAHRCADGFLMLPGVAYDSENPTPLQRKCVVCGADYKGVSQYCSSQCFEQDREARNRAALAKANELNSRTTGWFRKSENPRITSFETRLTEQDKIFLRSLRIGWQD